MVARMEKRVEALRQFKSPYAPTISFLGARLVPDGECMDPGPIYIFGKGHNPSQGLTRLYGEAAERDALYMRKSDRVRSLLDPDFNVIDEVPAEHVLHRGVPEDLGSSGCAAHNVLENAVSNAICELVERFAVARWWSGTLGPSRLDRNWAGLEALSTHVARLRSGAYISRLTEFFSLGRHGPFQTVMALSTALDGSQAAVAFAADIALETAAHRALLELLTVELETADLMAGRLSGETIDRESARGLVAARQEALAGSHAHLLDAAPGPVPKDAALAGTVAEIADSLASEGLPILLADLTRDDVRLPTFRAMFHDPALQPRFPKGYDLSPL